MSTDDDKETFVGVIDEGVTYTRFLVYSIMLNKYSNTIINVLK